MVICIMALFIVIFVRLLVPFSIFRWPLWGAVFSLIADNYDFTLLNAWGWGRLERNHYQIFDKSLDMYYLFFELAVSLKWKEIIAKRISALLFCWRLAGYVIFAITGTEKMLFFFPNVFENFFLLILFAKKFFPGVKINNARAVTAFVLIAGIPKVIQEYSLHIRALRVEDLLDFIKK